MARIGRPGMSREKKADLWERWKSGQCASDIARALERTKGAIHHVSAANGGIAPVARRRGPVALVLDEREEISRGMAAGRSIRHIAATGLVLYILPVDQLDAVLPRAASAGAPQVTERVSLDDPAHGSARHAMLIAPNGVMFELLESTGSYAQTSP